MEIPDDVIQQMEGLLRGTAIFPRTVSDRPKKNVWRMLDSCLLALRLPLYNERLQKKPAKPAAVDHAIQASLAILGAFAAASGTRQAIVSVADGAVRAISLQPRPHDISWNLPHLISPPEATRAPIGQLPSVSIEDMHGLAAKVVHAISGYNIGRMPNAVATLQFRMADGAVQADGVVREIGGKATRFGLS